MSLTRAGISYAVAAYFLWGVLPVYWKLIQQIPAHEILSHRMVWSLLFLLIVMVLRGRLGVLLQALRSGRTAALFLASAVLLSANWWVYIWAVNSGFIVDSSLGYFVNPLFTVFLGVVVLKEKPRPWQWVSIGIAGGGVLYLTFIYGSFPWIALVLAFTFGMYGLIRKTAPLGSMAGLTIETAYMLLPALVFLLYLHWTGQGAFGNVSPAATVLLAGAGIVTAVPLLFFAKGARQIPLTTIGLLHYIAPTLQFLLGVFLYGEVVASSRLVGFVLVWLALIIFSVDSVISTNRRNAKPVSTI